MANATIDQVRVEKNLKEQAATPTEQGSRVHMVAGGFLMYPLRHSSGRTVCSHITAPRVDSHPHRPELHVMPDTIGSVQGSIDIRLENGLAVIDLTGYDVQIGTHGAAVVDSTDDIADFGSLVCGARLKYHWLSSLPVQFSLGLAGGTLTPSPDSNSDHYCWSDCDGQPITRTISTVSRYTSAPLEAPVLTLTPRNGAGSVAPAVMNFKRVEALPLLLVNRAPDGIEKDDLNIDLAHVYSMLRLCDVGPELRISMGTRCPRSEAAIAPVADWLFDTFNSLQPMLFGRPHCGGRVIADV
jgi:hypothetical protein